MPRIELLQVPLFDPLDPYHYEYDNMPLQVLIQRENLINLALDNVISQMNDAIGTQNTVANRLNQSINPDGSLITAAVDKAMHTMDDHTDTENYVRMTAAQFAKLNMIADQATNVTISTNDGITVVNFNSGQVIFASSPSIEVDVQAPNVITFDLAFDPSFAHQHSYDLTPVPQNMQNPDYVNYYVNSIPSAYIAGSLRVYINGMRLSATGDIYVPGPLVTDPQTLLTFTPNPTTGGFALSSAISPEDVIRIDFDISLIS